MKNLAEFKREIKIGDEVVLTFSRFAHPYLNKVRKVTIKQTNCIAFEPLEEGKGPSYLPFPKASAFRGKDKGWEIFDGDQKILAYEIKGVA